MSRLVFVAMGESTGRSRIWIAYIVVPFLLYSCFRGVGPSLLQDAPDGGIDSDVSTDADGASDVDLHLDAETGFDADVLPDAEIDRDADRDDTSPTDADSPTDAADAGDTGHDADEGSTICDGPGTIVCDDFESGDLLAWNETGGSPSTTEGPPPPPQGTRALQLSYASHSSGDFIRYNGFLAAGPFMAARADIYIPSGVAFDWADLIVLGNARGRFEGLSVGLSSPSRFIVFNEMSSTETESPVDSVPRNRWFCFQLEIDLADSGGRISVFVDGGIAVEQLGDDTSPTPGYEFASFGFSLVDPQAPITIFADNVAFGTEPIPCD